MLSLGVVACSCDLATFRHEWKRNRDIGNVQLNSTKLLAKIENQLNPGNASDVLFQFKLQYKFQSENVNLHVVEII